MRRILTVFAGIFCAAMLALPLQAQTINVHATIVKAIPPGVHAQVANGVPAASTYEVNLTWAAPTGECAAADATFPICGWNVYRSIAGSGSYTQIATVTNATATPPDSYTDSTVTAGTAYDYIVETTASGGTSGPSNVASVVVPNPPGAPTSVTATPTGGSN